MSVPTPPFVLLARSTAFMNVVFVDVDDDEHVDDMEDSSVGSIDERDGRDVPDSSASSSETEWSTESSRSSDGTWQCSEDGSSQASEDVNGDGSDTGDDDDGEEPTDNAQSRQRKRARVSDGDSRPESDTDDDDQADNVSVIPHDAANEGEQKKEDEAVGGTEQEDEEEDEADGDDEAEEGGEDAKQKTDAKEGGKKETERKENEAEDETGEMTTPPHHSDRAPVAVAAPRRASVATAVGFSLRGFRAETHGTLATDAGSGYPNLHRWFKQTKRKTEYKMDEEENEEENVEEIEVENEDEEEAKRLSEITESYEVQQRVLNNLNAREQEQQSEFRSEGVRFQQLLAASRALVGRLTPPADEFGSED